MMAGGGLSTERVVDWVRLPLVPITVTVAGSGLGVLVTEIVRVEVPEPPEIEFVEKPVWIPPGALTDRVTVPVNPLIGETVIVVAADVPGGIVNDVGLAVIWKS